MKIKLLAVAALAVCGSGAFAAVTPVTCPTSVTTSADLVAKCVPEVTLYMAGASAQQPAVQKVLGTTSTVFNLARPLAVITKSTNLTDLGAKNTEIYYGFGAAGTDWADKRVAVAFNTANGSFAGVKAMLEAKDTLGIAGSLGGENASQGLLLPANALKGLGLSCTQATAWAAPVAPATTPTLGSYSCLGNGFNYVKVAPPGGIVGVQLALADVAPNQAMPGVIKAGVWTAAKFPLTVTGVQGFGVMVNDLALRALIKREKNAGRLASCGVDVTNSDALNAVTGSNVTAACQPGVTHADMAALVSGKATAAMISGDSADTTTITYNRRVDFSGTQASSNIQFAGQAATEGFADYTKSTGYLRLSSYGATPDANGNFSSTVTDAVKGNFVSTGKVGSGDVITAVSADTSTYAFGVVSLEKVWTPTKTKLNAGVGNDAASALKGASWVKVGGLSPNFDAAGVSDPKHRIGMSNGYPFQYEMVAIIPAAVTASTTAPLIAKVANAIVTGFTNPAYDLAGIAYLDDRAVAPQAAKFSRGGLGNNYSPLIAR